MGSLLTLILPALAPVFADGVRGVFAKFTGGAGGQPVNVDERIKLMQAETERLKALAQIDTPVGEPSQWVTNLRGSFRYIAISFIWLATPFVLFDPKIPSEIKSALLDVDGATLSFIIGERMYFNLRK